MVFLKNLQKLQENTCGLRNFQEHLFYRTPLDNRVWLFLATLLKWGTANSVLKTSDEYSLSRNTNLRSIVQVRHFLLGSINFHCIFSLVYTVYCQRQPPEYRCSMKKGVLKNFVNFIGKQLCWSLFLRKLQPESYFEEYLPTTAFALHLNHSLLLIPFSLYSI